MHSQATPHTAQPVSQEIQSPAKQRTSADTKVFDAYAFVPAAALRKNVKSNWDSKYIAANRPRLTEDEILQWADAHFARTGEWPRAKVTGSIPESPESTWTNIDSALRKGLRGLLGHSSLPLLLWERRGVRNHLVIPDFSEEEILRWVDAYHARCGEWPTTKSGPVAEAPDETWQIVNTALRVGVRGMPGGSSLPKFLSAKRGVRVLSDLPPLTEDLILEWADAHFRCTRTWPGIYTGAVGASPGESWQALNAALITGGRGLPGGTSLIRLLVERRGIHAPRYQPRLTEAQILIWADAHRTRRNCWPVTTPKPGSASDPLIPEAPGETWSAVNAALQAGTRGLPGGSSLSQILKRERGCRKTVGLTLLSEEMILQWADAHFARTGQWPVMKYKRNLADNQIAEAPGENWVSVNNALRSGGRGLPGGISLTQFLAKHRGKTPYSSAPSLSIAQILTWARAYHAQTGHWPTSQRSGKIPGTDESWAAINTALKQGSRGLPGGDTIASLLARECGYRNVQHLPPFTEAQILAWADAHFARTGLWPVAAPRAGSRSERGIPEAPEEDWKKVNSALRNGGRGLPGGTSLMLFLTAHRSKRRRIFRTTPLTPEKILAWAEVHRARTGQWPTSKSGIIEGTDGDTWSAISTALSKGCRGLPPGNSLARLLENAA